MSYRGSRSGSWGYYPSSPTAPRTPVSPSAMTYPGPGSRGSIRSVRSVVWDEVVDAIITADTGDRNSRIIDDDTHSGPHQPTIDEVEESEGGSVYSSLNERVNEPAHSAKPSVDATTLVNAPGETAEATSSQSKRQSRASIKFDFDIKLSDDLDDKLKLPEDAYIVHEESEDEIEELDPEPEVNEEEQVNEKDGRISPSGSHSGSSTVHEEQHDERPRTKDGADAQDQDVEAGPEEQQQTVDATKANYSAFPTRAKRIIVVGAASASIFAPLSMQIYLPSLTTLVTEFGVTTAQINLTVSVYMIFMAISPMIMGGFADVIGRRPAMLGCFAVYIVSCVMIALCQDYQELMGFRILQSIGASPTIAIASAVVADIVTAAERGSYAALVAVPVIFAPTLGPVIGGLLTQYLGWRSIFWFLLIAGAVAMLLLALCFPETCRVIVGDASAKAPKRYRSVFQAFKDTKPDYSQSAEDEKKRLKGSAGSTKALLWASVSSAVKMLCTRERFCLLFYVGLVFSGFQAIATELPTQFKAIYGFDHVMIGVMYLPLAGGAMISTAVFGKQMNKNFRKYAARAGVNIEAGQEVDMNRIDVEKARLEITIPSIIISTAGIVCWGWVLEARTSVAAPCVLLFVMGVGLNGVMATTNALLMDITQTQAGAVMAASNLTRCALGALASAAIQEMIDKLGLGWTYVVFGILFVAFSPMLLVHYFKGHAWRKYAKRRDDFRLAEAEGRPYPEETPVETTSPQDLAMSQPAPRSPKQGFFARRTDKQSVKAAAVEALVTAPAIPLVEMKPEEESSREDSVGSKQ
ncbi:unnamed protein product [Discula destructiva]